MRCCGVRCTMGTPLMMLAICVRQTGATQSCQILNELDIWQQLDCLDLKHAEAETVRMGNLWIRVTEWGTLRDTITPFTPLEEECRAGIFCRQKFNWDPISNCKLCKGPSSCKAASQALIPSAVGMQGRKPKQPELSDPRTTILGPMVHICSLHHTQTLRPAPAPQP